MELDGSAVCLIRTHQRETIGCSDSSEYCSLVPIFACMLLSGMYPSYRFLPTVTKLEAPHCESFFSFLSFFFLSWSAHAYFFCFSSIFLVPISSRQVTFVEGAFLNIYFHQCISFFACFGGKYIN